MSIKHLICISVCFIFAFNTAYSQYNAASTDYSIAKTETWTQDNAADSLKMINAFVCIAGHSGGNNRPNGTWRALIDELKCGLKQADEGATGALSLADVTVTSTRASDTSDQEMTAYFSSTSGSNYITDMTMNVSSESAFGLTMDFRWYESPDNTTTVNQSTMSNGFSDISVSDNNSDGNMDTIILHTEYSPAGGGDPLFRSGAFAVTYGPDNNVTASELSAGIDAFNSGIRIDEITVNSKRMDLTLMGVENSIDQTQGIENIPIVTTNGKIIPVSSLSNILYTTGPTQIRHIEGERAVTLQIKPADNIPLEEAITVVKDKIIEPLKTAGLPPDIKIDMSGTADELTTTWKAMAINLLVSIAIVYLLMTILFESFKYPFIIMLSVPPAAAGGVIGLSLLNLTTFQPLDMLTILGLVG